MRVRYLCLAIALAACGGPVTVEIPQTVIVEQTVPVTVEVEVTREVEVEVTRIAEVVVTATSTATPQFTATDTLTPTVTLTPSQTATQTSTPNVAKTQTAQAFAKLSAPRGDGFYLVGIDIAPGTWRSTAGNPSCYWQRSDKNQKILDNHFGDSGGAVTIRTTDFQFEAHDCGRWTYLSP